MRMLLALVLGLAAWWGVGWWLSPRPILALHYPDNGKLFLPPDNHSRVDFSFFVTEQDRLILHRPNVPSQNRITFEQFDLTTGKYLGSQECDASDYEAHPLARAINQGGRYFSILSYAAWPDTIRQGTKADFLIPDTQQRVTKPFAFSFGERIDEWINGAPWVARLIGKTVVAITDDSVGRVLWSVPIDYGVDSVTSGFATDPGSHLVLLLSQSGVHSVYAFERPLGTPSPWWSRSVGLLIAAVVLFASCRSRALSSA
jgi:hypothetical protein